MKTDEHPPYKGSCLCGSIGYEVDQIESHMAHCHCSMCRKHSGAGFSTYGEAKKENFRWDKGVDLLESYVASNGLTRKFCRVCGSSMTVKTKRGQEDIVVFALGTLDSSIERRPDAHVFVGSKANWSELNDELPKHNEGRGSDG